MLIVCLNAIEGSVDRARPCLALGTIWRPSSCGRFRHVYINLYEVTVTLPHQKKKNVVRETTNERKRARAQQPNTDKLAGMKNSSTQGHGGIDLTGAPNDQQRPAIADAPTTDAAMIHATASSPVATESYSAGNHSTQEHKESEVKEQSVDTLNASQQQTPEEGGIHQGSKRHKESRNGHYGGEQQAKKQKKRIDLVDPEEDLKNAQYFFDNGKCVRCGKLTLGYKPSLMLFQLIIYVCNVCI